MIYLGIEPDSEGEPFMVGFSPFGEAGVNTGFLSGDAGGNHSMRFWKYYQGGGTSGNGGWHIRHYGIACYLVVEFYENTPPVLTAESYGSVLSDEAKTLSCTVTDIDANDANQAGAATVNLSYKVNDGEWVKIACALASGTDTDGVWGGDVPAGTLTPGDVLTYFFDATDKAGLEAVTIENSYGYFAKSADVLLYYNDGSNSTNPAYYLYQAEEGSYDTWSGTADGPATDVLLNMYDHILRVDGDSPASLGIDEFTAWMASGTEATPKNIFWSSQEFLGAETGWTDTEFAADDWHNQYLGIGSVSHDLQYISTGGTYDQKWPVNPVIDDIISGNMAKVLADSGWQLHHDTPYELGVGEWSDGLTAGPGAVVCFTDSATGVAMGVHKETTTNKTVFIALDQVALNANSPYGTPGYWWPEYGYPFGGGSLHIPTLEWFGAITDVAENPNTGIAAKYELSQNYPNPFNPETRISYEIAKAGHVKLAVYNVLGQKVADLVDEHKVANTYRVTFDASNLTSGVYFYRLEIGDYSKTMKMMLLQ